MKKLLLLSITTISMSSAFSQFPAPTKWCQNKLSTTIELKDSCWRDSTGRLENTIFYLTKGQSCKITINAKNSNKPFISNNQNGKFIVFIDTVQNGKSYTVCLTLKDSINKCDTTICKEIYVNCNLGNVFKNNTHKSKLFFPNPANNKIYFLENRIETCNIYALHGKLVISNSNPNQNSELDISMLNKGTYIIEFILSNKLKYKQILIKT